MNPSLVLAFALLSLAPQERRPVPVPVDGSLPSDLRLELYDVAKVVGLPELERAVADLAARGPGRAPADALREFETLEVRRTQFEAQRHGLLTALRGNMQPPAGEATRVEWLPGGRVAVLAEPGQHAWVQAWLAQPRAFDGLFDVSTVLWTLDVDVEARELVARNRERLGAGEVEQLSARLEALGGERISAPRMLCFAFAPVHLRAGEELAYLSDWEQLELADRPGTLPSPVVAEAFDGFELEATCVPTLGGNVRLDVGFEYTRLERPIASYETTFARLEAPVVVQLPQWTTLKIEGVVELAADEVLLLAAEDEAAGKVVLALLRVQPVEAQRER